MAYEPKHLQRNKKFLVKKSTLRKFDRQEFSDVFESSTVVSQFIEKTEGVLCRKSTKYQE